MSVASRLVPVESSIGISGCWTAVVVVMSVSVVMVLGQRLKVKNEVELRRVAGRRSGRCQGSLLWLAAVCTQYCVPSVLCVPAVSLPNLALVWYNLGNAVMHGCSSGFYPLYPTPPKPQPPGMWQWLGPWPGRKLQTFGPTSCYYCVMPETHMPVDLIIDGWYSPFLFYHCYLLPGMSVSCRYLFVAERRVPPTYPWIARAEALEVQQGEWVKVLLGSFGGRDV